MTYSKSAQTNMHFIQQLTTWGSLMLTSTNTLPTHTHNHHTVHAMLFSSNPETVVNYLTPRIVGCTKM